MKIPFLDLASLNHEIHEPLEAAFRRTKLWMVYHGP